MSGQHVRTTGSHRHFKHAEKPNVVTIPGHLRDDVPVGTLKSTLRAAGIEQELSAKYAVIFERAENNWAAYVPDLPGCITTGKTLEETKANMQEAIRGHIETLRQYGELIPAPTSLAGEVEVTTAA